jgi:predicted nicotinamide N-methyase
MSDDNPITLPSKPHPIASAFFASHDIALRQSTSQTDESKVAKIRNSLGWRTRYASSTWYPITIVSAQKTSYKDLTFHVRQIFPAERLHIKNECMKNDEVDPVYGTGNTVWPGSIVLLKYIEKLAQRNDNPFMNRTVADLGAGTAITTIAAALFGAKFVACTDGCSHVVKLAASNVQHAIEELNGMTDHLSSDVSDETECKCTNEQRYDINGCKVVVQKYLWGGGSISDEFNPGSKYFDIILCADCIVPKLYPIHPLIDALDELSNENTVAYLSYEKRHYSEFDPAEEFLRLAHLRKLQVEIVPESELDSMYPASDIEVWKVTRMAI